jgi:hypothetical protein
MQYQARKYLLDPDRNFPNVEKDTIYDEDFINCVTKDIDFLRNEINQLEKSKSSVGDDLKALLSKLRFLKDFVTNEENVKNKICFLSRDTKIPDELLEEKKDKETSHYRENLECAWGMKNTLGIAFLLKDNLPFSFFMKRLDAGIFFQSYSLDPENIFDDSCTEWKKFSLFLDMISRCGDQPYAGYFDGEAHFHLIEKSILTKSMLMDGVTVFAKDIVKALLEVELGLDAVEFCNQLSTWYTSYVKAELVNLTGEDDHQKEEKTTELIDVDEEDDQKEGKKFSLLDSQFINDDYVGPFSSGSNSYWFSNSSSSNSSSSNEKPIALKDDIPIRNSGNNTSVFGDVTSNSRINIPIRNIGNGVFGAFKKDDQKEGKELYLFDDSQFNDDYVGPFFGSNSYWFNNSSSSNSSSSNEKPITSKDDIPIRNNTGVNGDGVYNSSIDSFGSPLLINSNNSSNSNGNMEESITLEDFIHRLVRGAGNSLKKKFSPWEIDQLVKEKVWKSSN